METEVEWRDRVINHIFATGLLLAGISGLPQVDTDVAARLQGALDELDTAIHELRAASLGHVATADAALLIEATAQEPLTSPVQATRSRSALRGAR
jgi:hypothetical protein